MSRSSSRWPPYARLPDFLPVPTRGRADGWTPVRQGDFIGFLAQTGSVAEAARQVGRSRESAYRLRRLRGAEGFAFAWDVAVAGAVSGAGAEGVGRHNSASRKFTPEEVSGRAVGVTLQVRMRRGRYAGTVVKSSTVMLLRHLKQLDRASRGAVW